MKLKTRTIAVPAQIKTVVANHQLLKTTAHGINMEVEMGPTGAMSSVTTGSNPFPRIQSGGASSFRELAAFLTAIADEMERRSVVQS